jgi:uncharacterized protein YehS (DUF1456 family)
MSHVDFDQDTLKVRLDGLRKFLAAKSPSTPVRSVKDGPNLEIATYVAKKLRIRMRDDDLRALLELAEMQESTPSSRLITAKILLT